MAATVRQALDAATARIQAEGYLSPGRDAELLLMHVLGCSLASLLTHPERVLSSAESAQHESLVTRRVRAEPVQYILGEQEFFGLNFRVTRDVLIPRPETEHLVEAMLELVDRDAAAHIVDAGTGSGAIAVALAHALPRSQVTAVELSPPALAVARQNAERHGVSARIRFLRSDLLAGLKGESFDAVVSNPPYIGESEVLEPQVRDYEPRLALYAGPTGLEIYERLVPEARGVLKPGGWLLMEIGHGQRAALLHLLNGWKDVHFVDDLQGIPRVAIATR
jgi:release factor glutamine methyltransferase